MTTKKTNAKTAAAVDRLPAAADPLLTEEETAELLATKPQTLSVWRTTKRYPLPYVKIGRNVRYKRSDILAFIESRTVAASV